VFPLQWQSKKPLREDSWKEYATADFQQFLQLRPFDRPYNLAAALGPGSGILDLEYDSDTGAATHRMLVEVFGQFPTVAYRSARGVHHWYQWFPELAERGKAVVDYQGIGIRLGTGDKGAYSVVPPSLHEKGVVRYAWLPGQDPWSIPIAPLPEPYRVLFLKAAANTSNSAIPLTRVGDDFVPHPGERHACALRLANLLAGAARLPRDLVFDMLMVYQDYVGKLGEDAETAEKEIRDMVSTVRRGPRTDDILVEVDFADLYESARQMQKELQVPAEEPPTTIPNVFPPWLTELGDIAWKAQIPRTLYLMTALVAISAATGASVIIRASPSAAASGLQLYGLGVGASGTGKSKTMKGLLGPFERAEAFCTNATSEALTSKLGKNPRGVMLKVAEGKQFTNMLGRYAFSGGMTESNNGILLEAWSGDTIAVARQDDRKNIRIYRPFLSVAAAIQPYNLRTFSVSDVMEGLVQRLLIYGTDDTPKDTDEQAAKNLNDKLVGYNEVIQRLLKVRPLLDSQVLKASMPDANISINPVELVLDEEAAKVWRVYASSKRSDEVQEQYPDEHPFRTDLLRHAEYVLRLTACLFLADLASSEETWEAARIPDRPFCWVPVEYVRRAIELMEWLWLEKRRLLSDIVEERFAEAAPPVSRSATASLLDVTTKVVETRKRDLMSMLKGKTSWTIREYCQSSRMAVLSAQQELELLIRIGLVRPSGNKNRVLLFEFVSEPLPPSEPHWPTST
jgi:hypothetical protein